MNADFARGRAALVGGQACHWPAGLNAGLAGRAHDWDELAPGL